MPVDVCSGSERGRDARHALRGLVAVADRRADRVGAVQRRREVVERSAIGSPSSVAASSGGGVKGSAQLLRRERHARALARARVLGRLERGPPPAGVLNFGGLRGWGRRGAPSAAATAASALTSALRKALRGGARRPWARRLHWVAAACRRRRSPPGRPASPSAATAATRGPRCRGGSAAGSSATARAAARPGSSRPGRSARVSGFRAFLAEHGEGVVKSQGEHLIFFSSAFPRPRGTGAGASGTAAASAGVARGALLRSRSPRAVRPGFRCPPKQLRYDRSAARLSRGARPVSGPRRC